MQCFSRPRRVPYLASILLAACVTEAPRAPAQAITTKPAVAARTPNVALDRYYAQQEELFALRPQLRNSRHVPVTAGNSRDGSRMVLQTHQRNLARNLSRLEAEQKTSVATLAGARNEYLSLEKAEVVEIDERVTEPRAFLLDVNLVRDYSLTIRVDGPRAPMPPPSSRNMGPRPVARPYSIKCDGPFSLNGLEVTAPPFERSGSSTVVEGQSRYGLRFVPGAGLRQCGFRAGKATLTLGVFPDFELVQNLDPIERCALAPQTANRRERLFSSTKYHYLSCPASIPSLVALDDAMAAAQAKIRVLAGVDLDLNALTQANLSRTLDALTLPQLDAIYVSALVFRYDFYGSILLELIERHARRGTPVRIMVSEVISLPKDIVALNALAARNPLVKVDYFKWTTFGRTGPGSIFDHLHRTDHVKAFVVIGRDPANDAVMIGGRNVHDGFVFKSAPTVSLVPGQVVYGPALDEPWGHWEDFEILVKDSDFVRRVARQMAAQFVLDRSRFFIRSTSTSFEDLAAPAAAPKTSITRARHLLSVPYKDDRSLETLVVELIDSAERRLDISSPYFRPPMSILSAIRRAAQRGVTVRVTTRIEIGGEFGNIIDDVFNDSNKATVNDLKNDVAVFEYDRTKWLHSKIIVVDEDLALVGSVNLNKRSFEHDLENAVLVSGRDFALKLHGLIDRYVAESARVTQEQSGRFFSSLLLWALDDKF